MGFWNGITRGARGKRGEQEMRETQEKNRKLDKQKFGTGLILFGEPILKTMIPDTATIPGASTQKRKSTDEHG
jgi:hypothetical protein